MIGLESSNVRPSGAPGAGQHAWVDFAERAGVDGRAGYVRRLDSDRTSPHSTGVESELPTRWDDRDGAELTQLGGL